MYEKCRRYVTSSVGEGGESVKLAGYIRKSGSAGVVRGSLVHLFYVRIELALFYFDEFS